MASKVYFADFRCPSWRENLPQKLARLMMTAGFGDIDMDGKYVAIKMHFGEPGNMAYLRPNWAKAVADLVKSQGGKPFLTDCNTLYIGGRKNALDHMESAYVNGFTPYSTGCHIIIADGLKGNDEVAHSHPVRQAPGWAEDVWRPVHALAAAREYGRGYPAHFRVELVAVPGHDGEF